MTTNDAGNNIKFIDCEVVQECKKQHTVCGDYTVCHKDNEKTVFILCDGIGSGIKANIAAVMCASRLISSIKSGISIYKACEQVVNTMHKARTENIPFAAFSIAQILNNGNFTVLSYEIPSPVLVQGNIAYIPDNRKLSLGAEVISEVSATLRNSDSLILVSDGITQAGMGYKFTFGWTLKGLTSFLNRNLNDGLTIYESAQMALRESCKLCGGFFGDDTTLSVLTCRKADVLNIMTGPPGNRIHDKACVDHFMKRDGKHVVCGSSTSEMVSRIINKPINMKKVSHSFFQPPQYSMEGIDLVTEGVITLNQLYNILEENPDGFDEYSCVSDLCKMIQKADIIRFFIGTAKNEAHKDISFKQMGIMQRHIIISLIVSKLKEAGKLVCEQYL